MAHTKGEWIRNRESERLINKILIQDKTGIIIAEVFDKKDVPLIQSAPDLLGALKKLQSWHEKYPPGRIYAMHQGQKMESELTKIVNMGIVAIKKAT